MCILSCASFLNSRLHASHENRDGTPCGFCLHWRRCFRNERSLLYFLPQKWHALQSIECTLCMCVSSFCLLSNIFEHTEHDNSVLRWVFWWATSSDLRLNSHGQCWHLMVCNYVKRLGNKGFTETEQGVDTDKYKNCLSPSCISGSGCWEK